MGFFSTIKDIGSRIVKPIVKPKSQGIMREYLNSLSPEKRKQLFHPVGLKTTNTIITEPNKFCN